MPRPYRSSSLTLKEIISNYSRETNEGCWEWRMRCRANYGQLKWKGKDQNAHRLSWEAHKGEIPVGKSVCHKCDNPPCVNPEHLFLGTHAENMADKKNKGRVPKGPSHSSAKLSDKDIPLIRADTDSTRKIGAKYGVSSTVVSQIKRRVLWAHVA